MSPTGPSEPPVTILSLDGGGIRGILAGKVLEAIDGEADEPLHRLFDLVAGASTGALLALGLALPEPRSGTRRTGGELAELYRHCGECMFQRSTLHKLRTLGGLLGSRYPSDPVEEVFELHFGGQQLSQAQPEVLVPAYDLESREPYYFKSWRARKDAGWDPEVPRIAKAATAAPVFFEPCAVPGSGASSPLLVDGGVIANNPAVSAFVEILADPELPDRCYIVSIGTGDQHESYDPDEAGSWGLLDWATRIVDVAIDGSQHEADRNLDRALCGPRDVYHRLQPSLDPGDHPLEEPPSGKLDDASRENQDALEALAASFLDEHGAQVSRIADELSAMVPDRAGAGRRSAGEPRG